MAPSLTKAQGIRAVSRGLLAILAGWIAAEVALSGSFDAWVAGGVFLFVAVVFNEHGTRTAHPGWHRLGRVVLLLGFVVERLFWWGLEPFTMMAFVVLLIGLGVAQTFERTFAPVYAEVKDPDVLRMVDAAAVGAYARALALLAMTLAISVLLAFLFPLALVRSPTLSVAVGLSAALIGLITLLALPPYLGRLSSARRTRRRTTELRKPL